MSDSIQLSLQYTNIGYIVLSKDNAILSINSVAQKLLGLNESASSLGDITNVMPERIHLPDHVRYCGIEHRACSFNAVEVDDTILKLFLSPIFEDKKLVGSLLTLEDVTASIEQKKARDQFLSLLVHDLRTPLTAVKGYSSMLQEISDDLNNTKNFQEIIGYIRSGSQNVLDMVNQFLDMARLEEGRIKFDLQKLDIVALARETVGELQVLAQEKGLELTLNTHEHKSLDVVADPTRTKQILSNLVGNALKFTEKGGITIDIRTNRIFGRDYG